MRQKLVKIVTSNEEFFRNLLKKPVTTVYEYTYGYGINLEELLGESYFVKELAAHAQLDFNRTTAPLSSMHDEKYQIKPTYQLFTESVL